MTFPTIPTVANGRALTGVQANTTATRTFPNLSSLTKNSGDLLIAIVVGYQSSLTSNIFSSWGGGFTEFHDSGGSSQMCVGMAYKWSTGSETGTFTVTQGGTVTGHAALILLSIAGAHATTPPEAGSRAVGTTSAADPASFNPAGWDAEDTLWICAAGCGETSTSGAFQGLAGAGGGNPTNYGDNLPTGISADVVGGVEGGAYFRQLNTAAEDCGPISPDTSNARNVAVMIAVRPAAAAAQDLQPALYSDGDTFFSPTASSSYALTAALFTNGATFFAPTAAPGAVNLSLSLYSDADTFESPTVAPGAVNLQSSLFTDGDAFHSATVGQGGATQDLQPGLYADSDTLHAPSVAATYALTAGLFSDADTFFSSTVASSYALSAVLFADGDTFPVPAVTPGAVGLQPSLYADGDTFFSPTVAGAGGPQELQPSLVTDADTFPAPTVAAGPVGLTPSLYTDGETFFAASVGQTGAPQALTASLYSDADAFFGPTVVASYALGATRFDDDDSFSSAAVAPGAVGLAAALFVDGDVFYSPVVVPEGGLLPALFEDADTFYTPTVAPVVYGFGASSLIGLPMASPAGGAVGSPQAGGAGGQVGTPRASGAGGQIGTPRASGAGRSIGS